MSVNIMALLNALPGACAQGLIWGIMAIGVFITYKILDLADLTVDGTMCTGGAVCIMMMMSGHSVWISLLVAFLAGILTQLGLYSINLRIMDNKANQAINVDKYPLLVSLRYIKGVPFYRNTLLIAVIILALLIAILYWFFGTELGCSIRATGSNPNMSRAQGINTDFTKILGLMISNGIVAFASGLYAQYQGFADINAGRGAIVIGLAAVIIGQVLFGKIHGNFAFKLTSVALGGVIYYLVLQVVLWLGLNANDLKLISAGIVAIFLAIPYLKGKYLSKTVKKGGASRA